MVSNGGAITRSDREVANLNIMATVVMEQEMLAKKKDSGLRCRSLLLWATFASP
jgi:hypothetical protein